MVRTGYPVRRPGTSRRTDRSAALFRRELGMTPLQFRKER
ncbi:hypothetical protein SAMN02799624_06238 [Paenibacillus sp. UNC496MF]|nr:hypothetical protein SAMN02799624_06238 [Paenibacillus sp. UNC496MF]